jgi:hypothetical protein
VVHHRAVPHDLHVDLDVLRSARLSVQQLIAAVQAGALDEADLVGLRALAGGAALIAEHDRLLRAARRAAREFGELDDALGNAVAALQAAESHATRSLTAVDR